MATLAIRLVATDNGNSQKPHQAEIDHNGKQIGHDGDEPDLAGEKQYHHDSEDQNQGNGQAFHLAQGEQIAGGGRSPHPAPVTSTCTSCFQLRLGMGKNLIPGVKKVA